MSGTIDRVAEPATVPAEEIWVIGEVSEMPAIVRAEEIQAIARVGETLLTARAVET